MHLEGSEDFKQQQVTITDGAFRTVPNAPWYHNLPDKFLYGFWDHEKEAALSYLPFAIIEASVHNYGLHANAGFLPFCLSFAPKLQCKNIFKSYLNFMTGVSGASSTFFNLFASVGNKPTNAYTDPNYWLGLLAQMLLIIITVLALVGLFCILVSPVQVAWEKTTMSEFSNFKTKHQKSITEQVAKFAHTNGPNEKIVLLVCLFFEMSHAPIVACLTVAVAFKCVVLEQNHYAYTQDKNGGTLKPVRREVINMMVNVEPTVYQTWSVPVVVDKTHEPEIGVFCSMIDLLLYIPGFIRLFLWRDKSGKGS
jgi:hypothetical protein